MEAGRLIAATVYTSVLFSMAGRLNSLHDSDPLVPLRNCLIRSAGQKIRMGSSAVQIVLMLMSPKISSCLRHIGISRLAENDLRG